jgi:hypothetical protein
MPFARTTFTSHYRANLLIALSVFLLLPITPACARSGDKVYFPLAAGAKWEYTGHFSCAGSREFSIRATARVDGETLINGKRYFKFVTSSDFTAVPGYSRQIEDVRYYRIAEDGIYFRPGNDSDKPDLLEMPLPIPIGVRWLSGTNEAQAERAGTITIGGRDYRDCLKVTFRLGDGARSTENYYAPGVGVVKTVYVNTTEPKSVIELTLEKYEP